MLYFTLRGPSRFYIYIESHVTLTRGITRVKAAMAFDLDCTSINFRIMI